MILGGGGDRSLTDAVTQDVWTVEGLSGEPYTHHNDAFNMTASHLRRGQPHIVIALIPRQQKVPTSLELYFMSAVLQQRALRKASYVPTLCVLEEYFSTIITELPQFACSKLQKVKEKRKKKGYGR